MRRKCAARISGLVLLLTLLAGCEGNVLLPGGTRASWRYVESGWGGLATGAARFSGRLLLLPLRLGIHPSERTDSGTCFASLRAKVRGTWIVASLNRGICGPGSVPNFEATLPQPPAGHYNVVYDDALAGTRRSGKCGCRENLRAKAPSLTEVQGPRRFLRQVLERNSRPNPIPGCGPPMKGHRESAPSQAAPFSRIHQPTQARQLP